MRLLLLVVVLPLMSIQSKCGGTGTVAAQTGDTVASADSIVEFTISSVGDLMCHSTQFNYAKVSEDSFNFEPCFEYVLPWLQKPDLLLGNLETTLAGTGKPYSGYPYFNTPDDYAVALKKIGFDFIITANNHSNDTGEKGIYRTLQVLDELGLPTTGSYTSQKDRDSIRIVDVKGVKIAIIAYTYSTNGNPLTEGKPWLVNLMDSSLIKTDIENSRKAGAELVLVFYHFGEEYQRLPNQYQKNFVDHAVQCGADLVLGSHVHVLQPADFFKGVNSTLDTGFVAYSMGNFISNQQDEYTDEGVIFNIHLAKNLNTNKLTITSVDYLPTWVYKGKNEAKKLHVVFPALNANDARLPEFVIKYYQDEVNKAIKHTTATMNTYTDKIKPVSE
jgi:poly-gamma-glutamate capsule biosynthesis protein CapA/YwtB (metallophosphatase superfamily)